RVAHALGPARQAVAAPGGTPVPAAVDAVVLDPPLLLAAPLDGGVAGHDVDAGGALQQPAVLLLREGAVGAAVGHGAPADLGLLLEDEDLPAGVLGQERPGDEPSHAGPHDDHVALFHGLLLAGSVGIE